ncbi:MAG: hypothetical protein AAF191_14130, partial [Verrucomicrobiota bacterium]
VSLNLEKLEARGAEMMFAPGTHDFVAFDMAWGGKHYPSIPLYLTPNSGHGQKKTHPRVDRGQANKSLFLLRHFFPEKVAPLLVPPKVTADRIGDDRLRVEVTFAAGSGEESGRIWWMFDRPMEGSPGYLRAPFREEHWADMKRSEAGDSWQVEISLEAGAKRVDFFSNHRKTISYQGRDYRNVLSSPYTRVEW